MFRRDAWFIAGAGVIIGITLIYSFIGYILGFIFRSLRLILGVVIYTLLIIAAIAVYFAWLLIPLYIIYRILRESLWKPI